MIDKIPKMVNKLSKKVQLNMSKNFQVQKKNSVKSINESQWNFEEFFGKKLWKPPSFPKNFQYLLEKVAKTYFKELTFNLKMQK